MKLPRFIPGAPAWRTIAGRAPSVGRFFFLAGLWIGCVFAILMPLRFSPIPNFLPETFAVTATMAGCALMFAMRGRLQLQLGVVQLAVLGFCLWILLGLQIHPPNYADALAWPLASLLAATCAAGAGQAFREHGALATATRALAALWIAASLGTAAIQWYQMDHPNLQLWWLMPRPEAMQPFGNVAQRNHIACVHALAILGFGMLLSEATSRLSRAVLVAGAGFAFVALVMTGSRIGTIMGAGAVLAVVQMFPGANGPSMSRTDRLKRYALALVCYGGAYVATQAWLFSLPGMAAAHSAGTRWTTYSNLSRVTLFELAWDVLKLEPLAGIGWGNLSRETLLRLDGIDHPQFANNTHNIVTHLAAETGLVGALLVLPMLGWVVVRAFREQATPQIIFGRTLLVLVLLYSMTEFPLWQTYFLLPFAFIAGLFDKPLTRPRISQVANASLVACALAMVAGGCWAMDRYMTLSRQVATIMRPVSASPELRSYVMTTLRSPGFASITELLAFALIHTDADSIEDKIQLGDRVVGQYIDATLLLKQAVLLALAGRVEPSAGHLVAACRFYPHRCVDVHLSIKILAGHDEKTFGPVLRRFIEKAKADPRVPRLPLDDAAR